MFAAGGSWDDDDDRNDGRRGRPDRRPGGGPQDDDDEGDDDRVPLKMLNRGKERAVKRGDGNEDSSEEDGMNGARRKMGGGRRMAFKNHKGRPREDEEDDDGRRGKSGGRMDKRRMWSMQGRGGPEDNFGSGEGKGRGNGEGRRRSKGKGRGKFGKSARFSFSKRGPPVQWKPWEESECLWVDQVKEIPESCHLTNLVDKLPSPVAKYYASKAFETYEMVKKIFKDRGLTEGCGHCSRKVACRQAAFSPNKYFVNPVADDKCLCCCGDFYPDAALGKCMPVKHGNRYPPMDIDLQP
uniref:Uncharacterized protein n=1 Tax=Romanomermis culicivorax TaxID=13658 RepID=A0A915KBK7_ROMCU